MWPANRKCLLLLGTSEKRKQLFEWNDFKTWPKSGFWSVIEKLDIHCSNNPVDNELHLHANRQRADVDYKKN
jgi:hypothetical protein